MEVGSLKSSKSSDYNCFDSNKIYCTDIIFDDYEEIRTETKTNISQNVDINEDYDNLQLPDSNSKPNSNSNDTKFDDLNSELDSNLNSSLGGNELQRIPRNKISAFKSFRKGTFRLVPTEDMSSCLIKNSNNSNRFVKQIIKSNNNDNEESLFINRINKNVMLRKITEIASPYLHDKSFSTREFKRIIPHPIFDDKRNTDLLNISFSNNKSNNNTSNRTHSTATKKLVELNKSKPVLIEDINKITKSPKESNGNLNLDEYEKMLEKKLSEIRQLKNISNKKDNFPTKTQDGKFLKERTVSDKCSLSKHHQHHHSIAQFPSLSETKVKEITQKESLTRQRTYSDKITLNIPNQNTSKANIESNRGKSTKENFMNNISNSTEAANSQMLCVNHKAPDDCKTDLTSSEIFVLVDDGKFSEPKRQMDNIHIPLFFRSNYGKKLRFKIRNFNQMGQAMKAFCNRMGVELLTQCKFYLSTGRSVNFADTPFGLGLKPYDIIIVKISVN